MIPALEALVMFNPAIYPTIKRNMPKNDTSAMNGRCSFLIQIEPPDSFTVKNSSNELTGILNPLKTKILKVSGVPPRAFFATTALSPHKKQVVTIAMSASPNLLFCFMVFSFIIKNY
ncbi:unnamed protein product [marine sediment metagenome]|uniref:Uncharacterized protein n=1 Tax=marine sediment metagenome TaxID=412755 RepID=X0ZJ81_9ZZZZ